MLCLGFAGLLAAGCGPADQAGNEKGGASTAVAPQAGERSFQVQGVIRGFPEDGRSLLIRHEEIPGYMPKMTMELTVRDTNEMAGLKAGDTIEFRLVARAEDHFIDTLRRVKSALPGPPAEDPGSAGPTLSSASQPELKPGDAVPGVSLTSEAGETIGFETFRGRALAFTFFFTRCPIPDFCPRMNRNLLDARQRLSAKGGAVTNWQFLSISFDAAFDTPAVLRSHATVYRGDSPDRWLFASADPAAMAKLAPAFDLKVAKEGGSFSHNLRTVVLDPEGRVFRQFDGNRWTADELAEAMEAACRMAPRAGAAGARP